MTFGRGPSARIAAPSGGARQRRRKECRDAAQVGGGPQFAEGGRPNAASHGGSPRQHPMHEAPTRKRSDSTRPR